MDPMVFKGILCAFLGVATVSCAPRRKTYVVRRVSEPVDLSANWSAGPWQTANRLELKNYMGERPAHFPQTEAKLLYDDKNIYVSFRVEDQYVRAVAKSNQTQVCGDSSVEFFFSPSGASSESYFNLEMNCGGTFLFYYGGSVIKKRVPLDLRDCEQIEVFHSLPKIIDPEIDAPTIWLVQYRIPLEILTRYCSIDDPASGVKWRANFFKIADNTSHPHWLTWSVVRHPTPAFHLPEYFGTLEFE